MEWQLLVWELLLLSGLIAKATEDTIYQMQVDIVIREKAKGLGICFQILLLLDKQSVNDSKKAGFINSFGGGVKNANATGNLNSNMVNAQSQSFETDYIEHKTDDVFRGYKNETYSRGSNTDSRKTNMKLEL